MGAPGRVVTLIPDHVDDPFLDEVNALTPVATMSPVNVDDNVNDSDRSVSPSGDSSRFYTPHTLVDDSTCWGVAFKIDPCDKDAIMSYLHHRERGGYSCVVMPVTLQDQTTVKAVCWMATLDNEEYIGHRPVLEMSRQINNSRGESGWNRDYLFNLHDALVGMGCLDTHIAVLRYYVHHYHVLQDDHTHTHTHEEDIETGHHVAIKQQAG